MQSNRQTGSGQKTWHKDEFTKIKQETSELKTQIRTFLEAKSPELLIVSIVKVTLDVSFHSVRQRPGVVVTKMAAGWYNAPRRPPFFTH